MALSAGTRLGVYQSTAQTVERLFRLVAVRCRCLPGRDRARSKRNSLRSTKRREREDPDDQNSDDECDRILRLRFPPLRAKPEQCASGDGKRSGLSPRDEGAFELGTIGSGRRARRRQSDHAGETEAGPGSGVQEYRIFARGGRVDVRSVREHRPVWPALRVQRAGGCAFTPLGARRSHLRATL
jgi:hypothetical protein